MSDEQGPVGPFRSWAWLYATVLVYGTVVILLLYAMTRLLDPS